MNSGGAPLGGIGGLKALPPRIDKKKADKRPLPGVARHAERAKSHDADPSTGLLSVQENDEQRPQGLLEASLPSGADLTTVLARVQQDPTARNALVWVDKQLRGQLGTTLPLNFPQPAAAQQPSADASDDSRKLDPKLYYEPVAPSNWRPDNSDSYLSLYRRAYCSNADVATAPVMVATLSALAWFRLLPLAALLLAAPIVAVLSVYCCVVRVAGLRPSDLNSRKTVLVFVLGMEVLVPALYATHCLAAVSDRLVYNAAFLTATAACLGLHLWCMGSEPGYVALQQAAKDGSAAAALAVPPEIEPLLRFCDACNFTKPLRAKHCRTCNRCVHRFDHHCPAISNCVGEANMRAYVLYLASLWTAMTLFVRLGAESLWRASQHRLAGQAASAALGARLAAFWAQCEAHQGIALAVVSTLFLSFVSGFILLRTLVTVAGNVTLNELACRRRYTYLQDGAGDFCNRFDAGPTANCLQFWGASRKDWAAERDPRNLLSLLNIAPPRASVTAVVRLWESRQRTLMAAREQQRQAREEWLLRTYGGVVSVPPQAPPADAEQQTRDCNGCKSYLHQHQAAVALTQTAGALQQGLPAAAHQQK